MRRILVIALVLGAHVLTGWGWHREAPPWPQAGPMPDAPVPVKPYRYAPVTSGAMGSSRPPRSTRTASSTRRGRPKSTSSSSAARTVRPV